MVLDFRNILIAIAVCCFLFAGGLFFFQARQFRKNGVLEWIIGQFIFGFYWLFVGLRGSIPDLLSVVVANACLSAGYSFLYVAVRKFQHAPYRRDLFFLPAVITILFFLFFWAYVDDIYIRSVYITLLSGIQTGHLAAILLRDASLRIRRSQWLTGCLFVAISTLWFIRLLELLASPGQRFSFPEMNPFWLIVLGLGSGIVILTNIGALLMIRERSEEDLRRSEERHRRLFENSVMGISEELRDGRLIRANMAYAQMFGYSSPEAMLAENLKRRPQLYTNPEEREEVLRILSEKGFMEHREICLTRRDGTPFFAVMTARGIRGSDGSLLGFQTTHMDITDRKRAEEERKGLEERLQRAEKMEALGVLAGGVAHDLNNVLGVLVGYSELLLYDIAEESPLREHVENILTSGERAGAIVQDLLTLARRGVHTIKVIDLNKTIRDCITTLECERLCTDHPDIRITTELGEGLLKIKGSPLHLGKTLMNLLINAAESMAHGGDIVIRTENRSLDRPVKGYEDVAVGDYVVLSVSDKGGGISREEMRRIFEPFYTKKVMGKSSGTGLGLAVVWGTVKDHNGYISVESEKGEGTTFTLYFPVTREETTEEKTVPVTEYMGRGESILVVDDVKEQRELAIRMLGVLDYRVTSAASGEAAVEYLRSNKVDLIVLDMIMDPGIDGLDTYKKIIEIHPGQKAIIVSGFSETERVMAAHALGVGAYVRKPYLMERLGIAIRKELDREASQLNS